MVLNTWLRYGILAGLFLLPLLPLIVSSSLLFPFISGKGFFFRIIVEIVFAAWLLLSLRDRNYRPTSFPLVWSGAIFLVVLILATIFSVDPFKSFWSNFERMEGLALYLHLAAYFTVLISMFKSEKWWRYFFATSLAVSVIVSIHALIQLSGGAAIHQGGVRIDANLGNATYLAVYLLFHIFLAAWWWATSQAKNYYLGVSLGIIVLVQLFLLYHTATRGAIIGLLLGMVVSSLIIGFKTGGRARVWAISLPITLIILAGAFYLVRDSDFVQTSPVLERFASISLSEGTVQSRFLIWRLSLAGVAENPILGWGPENYNIVFNKYYDPRLWPQEQWFDRSHNIYLDWLIHTGFLGLLSYLGIFALAFWGLIKTIKHDRSKLWSGSMMIGLLVAYMVHNFFVFDSLVSYFLFLGVMGYVVFLNQQEAKKPFSVGEIGTRGSAIAAVMIVVVLGLTFNFINLAPIKTGRSIINALSPLPAGLSPAESVNIRGNFFSEAVTGSYFGRAEAREQLMQLAVSVMGEAAVSDEQKLALLQYTFGQLDAQTKESPLDARPHLFLGNLLLSLGNNEQALPYLKRAAELSPKKHAIIFALAWAEIKTGEVVGGLKRLKDAIALAPDYFAATEAYAVALKETGEADQATNLIKSFITTYPQYKTQGERLLLDF